MDMHTQPDVMPPSQGIHLMAKPVGPLCNLDCSYCFYLEKEAFFPSNEKYRMSGEILDAYVKNYIAAQSGPEVEFTWQGGEPTLLGTDFFAEACRLQRLYANGKTIRNTLQTNATLINVQWAEFLASEKFLVGVSLDGPRELHDLQRRDKQGRSSFDDTVRGIQLLLEHGVPVNALVTVTHEVSHQALPVYHFLKQLGLRHIQFNPVVERLPSQQEHVIGLHFSRPPKMLMQKPKVIRQESHEVTPESVRPAAYGQFLNAIYDEWVRNDVGTIHVMNFEWALAAWCQLPATVCLFAPRCGKAAIVEHDGSVYSCDHFMYPEYRLGNLQVDQLNDMMQSEQQRQFGAQKERLPSKCMACPFRFACNGECPKNRFAMTHDGETGLNYLCDGYFAFFNHITPTMNAMAKLVAHNQPAALVMEALKGPLIVTLP